VTEEIDPVDELDEFDIEAHDLAVAKATKCKARSNGAAKENGEKRTPQADKLIALSAEAKLFHTADGNCFADIVINDHRETWPTRSKGFRRWLTRRYFEEEGGAPNNEAISTALGPTRILTRRSERFISASAAWTEKSISISVTQIGARSRSTPQAGELLRRHR
jgi:hypothetical protein